VAILFRSFIMYRRLVPLAVLVAAVLGCAKKETGGGGGDPSAGDPNATYAIKIRTAQPGDRYAVVRSKNSTVQATAPGGRTDTKRESEKQAYTETVQEVSPETGKPTRLTREYTEARKTLPNGKEKVLGFEGKTVVIEKKGAAFVFKYPDGKSLPPADAAELRQEFGKERPGKTEDLLPKDPIRLNESWSPGTSVVTKSLAEELQLPVDLAASTVTGKLTRAYVQDGKQFGVVEVRFDLPVGAPGGKGPVAGNLVVEMILDTPIDGSSYEGEMRTKVTGTLKVPAPGGETQVVPLVEGEMTVRQLK
jgi:hypothetical protein